MIKGVIWSVIAGTLVGLAVYLVGRYNLLFVITWTTFAIWSAVKGEIVLALVFGFAALAAYLIVRHDLRCG